jgi:hypothetical protein
MRECVMSSAGMRLVFHSPESRQTSASPTAYRCQKRPYLPLLRSLHIPNDKELTEALGLLLERHVIAINFSEVRICIVITFSCTLA